MSNTTQDAHAPEALIQTCKLLFGEHPEDVVATVRSAADALNWLEEIFKTISRESIDARNGCRIKHLADAGAHIAFDIASLSDRQHESMAGFMFASGVLQSKGGSHV